MQWQGNLKVEMLSRQILMFKKKSFMLSHSDGFDHSVILTQTRSHTGIQRANTHIHPPLMDGKF